MDFGFETETIFVDHHLHVVVGLLEHLVDLVDLSMMKGIDFCCYALATYFVEIGILNAYNIHFKFQSIHQDHWRGDRDPDLPCGGCGGGFGVGRGRRGRVAAPASKISSASTVR